MEAIIRLVKKIPDSALNQYGVILTEWLVQEANGAGSTQFDEVRARTLLGATNLLNEPTLLDFNRAMASEKTLRLAIFDLLSVVATAGENLPQPAAPTAEGVQVEWLRLAVAAHAYKHGYPLYQLDPASPPSQFSPAGQLLSQAAGFLRRQVSRTATERDKAVRKINFDGQSAPPLAAMPTNGQAVAAVPPYFRPPVPVNYAEVASTTLRVEVDAPAPTPPAVTRGSRLVITQAEAESTPLRVQPRRRVVSNNPPRERARPRPQIIKPVTNAINNLTAGVRRSFSNEKMQLVKLSVQLMRYPGGPVLPGVQVVVSCRGVRTQLAGTTDAAGTIRMSLPVRVRSGLTYQIEVTWPHELGGRVERKSITLNTQRAEFAIPFYHTLSR